MGILDSPARIVQILRKVVLGVASFFAIIIMSLSAHVIHTSVKYIGGYFDFAALAIATSLLTLLTCPAMLVLDLFVTGAVTSLVITDIVWLAILSILWLATGGDAANTSRKIFNNGCDYVFSEIAASCHEVPAVSVFSFFTWLLLMFYTGILLVLSFVAHNRGQKPWFSTVKEGDFLVAPDPNKGRNYPGNPTNPGSDQVPMSVLPPAVGQQPLGYTPDYTPGYLPANAANPSTNGPAQPGASV